MRRFLSLPLFLVLFGGFGWIAGDCCGQETGPRTPDKSASVAPASDTDSDVSIAKAQEALDLVSQDEDAPEAISENYREAIASLESAARFRATTAKLQKLLADSPETLKQLEAEIQKQPSPREAVAQTEVPDDAKDLERAIAELVVKVESLNEQQSQLASALTNLQARPIEISSRSPEVQKLIGELARQISVDDSANAASPLAKSESFLQKAQHQALLAEQSSLDQEKRSTSAANDVASAQHRLVKAKLAAATASLNHLQDRLDVLLSDEVERFASSLPPEIASKDADVVALTDEVKSLTNDYRKVVNDLKAIDMPKRVINSRLESLSETFDAIQKELTLGSGGPRMAQILIELDHLSRSNLSAIALPVSLDEARLRAFHIAEKQRRQDELERQFAEHSDENIGRWLQMRADVLDRLHTQYDKLSRSLADIENDRQQFANVAYDVRHFVSEKLLGFSIQSCEPLSLQTFAVLPEGIAWYFSREHASEIVNAFGESIDKTPSLGIAVVVIFVLLLVLRRRMLRLLAESGTKTRRISTDRMGHTFEALVWTILLAAPLPLLFRYCAGVLSSVQDPSDWIHGLADSVQQANVILASTCFLVATCRPAGLGTAHFGWSEPAAKRVARYVRQFAWIYIPTFVVASSLRFGSAATYLGSVGMVSFQVEQVGIALLIWRMLRNKSGVLSLIKLNREGGADTHWRQALLVLLLSAPVGLIVVSSLGYVLAAISMAQGLLVTGGILFLGDLAYCLALRWLRIRHRRLAFAEAIEARRAKREQANESQESEQPEEIINLESIDEQGLDIRAVGEQTQSMLKLITGLTVLVFIIAFWSEAVPVLPLLDDITIPFLGVDLLKIAYSTIAIVVTFVAVKNMPGLLDLVVLRRQSIQPGTRHAIATLCQYVGIAVGSGVVFNILEMDWSKFGWMAAALSVGIGFGLQEVVANFVCGLILLSERPIRVGDIVTLDGTTGTVTKIHLRATTITNWDRQEFVVPNRNLITGTILNWTLSATINRIVLPVGVAYGSNYEDAMQILLDVANDHPLILDDPAPIASLEQFGDSSVNLMLRCYLPDMDGRIRTTTELHSEIGRRFDEAGIVIPFPQHDLNLGSGWEKDPFSIRDKIGGQSR